MSPSQNEQQDPTSRSARKVYKKPQVQVYGAMRDLTGSVGLNGKDDGEGKSGKKTKM